jgi:hypothetical protein
MPDMLADGHNWRTGRNQMTAERAGRSRLIIGRKDLRKKRPCMCCAQPFISYGNHNRLCARCKNQESDFSCLGADLSRR